MDPDNLYQRYVDEYSDYPRYTNGSADISEKDLLDLLTADLDNIRAEYGSLGEYADDDDEGTVLEIYSLAEAQVVYDHLKNLIG